MKDQGKTQAPLASRLLRRSLLALCMTGVVGTSATLIATPAVAGAATTTTRSATACDVASAASANVFEACVSATDYSNGSTAWGNVTGTSCHVYLPTGLGWTCDSARYGSYKNTTLNAWENWLNDKLIYTDPTNTQFTEAACVYVRIDTKANGSQSYQRSMSFGSTGMSC